MCRFFLDVDHFKKINDTFGHKVGDSVLQVVALRIQDSIRDSDAVGRYGGDEFLVVLEEINQNADATAVAKKIIQNIAVSTLIDDNLLHVSISVGIAIYPEDTHDAETLIGLADEAMYQSKRSGGGAYTLFSELIKKPCRVIDSDR